MSPRDISTSSITPASPSGPSTRHREQENSYAELLDTASDLLEMNRSQYAILACNAAAAANPDWARAYVLMLEAAAQERDLSTVIYACRELIRLDPSCVEAYINLEEALLRQGDTLGAMEATTMLTLLEPDFGMHRLRLGELYQHLGNIQEAIRCFTLAMDLAESDEDREMARASIENLDIFQLNQIASLAMADSYFRNLLLESPLTAAESRGYFLSQAGENMLRDFCAYALADMPPGTAPRYH
jgi:tetratricopeptide (TPR) repeat protein